MQDNMQQIEQTEAVIEDERTALKAHQDLMEDEQKKFRDEIFALDKQLRV